MSKMGEPATGLLSLVRQSLLPLCVVAAVAGVFAFLVATPGLTGPGQRLAGHEEAQAPRDFAANLFEDQPTRVYLRRFRAAAPEDADALSQELARHVAGGGGRDEAGLIVLAALWESELAPGEVLGQAPAAELDAILRHVRTGLATLERDAPDYCLGERLQRFEHYAQQDFYREASAAISHGGRAWAFALELHQLVLEASLAAQETPQYHGPVTYRDRAVLDRIGLQAMGEGVLWPLFRAEGQGRAEMDAALEGVNFCTMGLNALDRFLEAPEDSRARLAATGIAMVRSGAAQRALQSMFVY